MFYRVKITKEIKLSFKVTTEFRQEDTLGP